MSPVDLAVVDQAKAAWAAVAQARAATMAAWWAVVAAFAGAVVNTAVVAAAFIVQHRQAMADRALADRADARLLLGATVAIGEAYAGLIAASQNLAAIANIQGMESESLRIGWADDLIGHFLKRELSDYILIQDLLRVRAIVRAAIGQVDHQIRLAQNGMPFDQARAPLTNKLLGFAAAFQEIHTRAMGRQDNLRRAAGMPEVIIATAGERRQWQ
jgi:hypothetical protein